MNEWWLAFIFSAFKIIFYVMLGGGWLWIVYQQYIKLVYPIAIVILRNTGGGHDNRSASLHPKVYLRGRVIKGEYGHFMRVHGFKGEIPMGVFSKEYSHPFGRSEAFIIYEKEFNQFFPTKMRTIDKEKFDMIEPVKFANTTIKLEPMPIDAVTPFTFNMKQRQARIVQGSMLEKYMPFIALSLVIVCFIVGLVLFFDWSADRMDAISGNINQASNSFGEKIAGAMETGGTNNKQDVAPGGSG